MPNILSRGFAYSIDCLCAFVLFLATKLLVFSPLRSLLGITDDWFRSGLNTEIYTLLTISIPVWLYFSILESSRWQATLGKRLLRLKVVDPSTQGSPRYSQTLLRTAIKLLPWELAHIGNNLPEPLWYAEDPSLRIAFLFSGILMLAYMIVIAINPHHRGIHDMLAGTEVIRVHRAASNAEV